MYRGKVGRMVSLAIANTRVKIEQGLMVSCSDPNLDELLEDVSTPKGDRETVYSIASLYSEGDEYLEVLILDNLEEHFKSYF